MLRLLATSTSAQAAAAVAALRSPAAPLFAAYSTVSRSTSVNHNRGGVSAAAAAAALVGLVAASAASQEGGSTARCQAAISPNEPVLKSPIVMVDRSGARLEVYPWGAHVTSYKTAEGRELIFLSRDAILDGKNAEFGQPDKSYPQHGFLRNNYWKVVPSSRRYDDRGGATIAFELDLNDVINARGDGKWGPETRLNARCTLSLAFDRDSLTTTITMTNTGDSDWDFQVLLHNYFMVRGHAALDGEQCYVRGLEGYGVSDKVSGEEYMSGGEPVTVPDKLIDRVYTPPAGKAELNLVIGTGDSSTVELTARGNVDGRPVAVSGVVWNPHEEKAKGMSDFGSDQYRDMLCVEPGLLDKVPALKPGRSATFTQVIKAV